MFLVVYSFVLCCGLQKYLGVMVKKLHHLYIKTNPAVMMTLIMSSRCFRSLYCFLKDLGVCTWWASVIEVNNYVDLNSLNEQLYRLKQHSKYFYRHSFHFKSLCLVIIMLLFCISRF